MKKCPTCNSCLKEVLLENSLYRYCTLCKDVYTLRDFLKVEDLRVKRLIANKFPKVE
jgi:hypothetical protein